MLPACTLIRRRRPLGLLAVGLLTVIVGCEGRATTERIQDKRETVAELTDELETLKDEKTARIEQAAAEARQAKREEIDETIDETTQRLEQHREALVALRSREEVEQELDRELDALRQRIEELEPQPSAQAPDDPNAQPLTEHCRQVEQQLQELRSATPERWQERRAETERAVNDLRQAVNRTAAHDEQIADTEPRDTGEKK